MSDGAARGRVTAGAGCGLAAAALALAVPLLAACPEPGYSHVAQYISELGARGAAHAGQVAAAGFAPTGLLVLAFLALASGALPASRRKTAGVLALGAVGAAYLAAAVFPCDPGCPAAGSFSQSVHSFFGLLEYVGACAGLLLVGSALRRTPGWRVVAAAAVVAAFVTGVGLAGMLTPALAPIRGVSQRLAEAAIFGWIAGTSVSLLRRRGARGRHGLEPEGRPVR